MDELDDSPLPDFADTYCVVTMSSTVGVHAVLAGVPVLAGTTSHRRTRASV